MSAGRLDSTVSGIVTSGVFSAYVKCDTECASAPTLAPRIDFAIDFGASPNTRCEHTPAARASKDTVDEY
jgi:hypothetical protein